MLITRIAMPLLNSGDYSDIGARLVNGAVDIVQKDVFGSILILFNEILVPFALILLIIFIFIYGLYIGALKKKGSDDLGDHIRNLIIAFVVFVALGAYSLLATNLFGQIMGG